MTALVAGGVYFFLNIDEPSPLTLPQQETKQEFSRQVPAGAREYISGVHHFSLLHPEYLNIEVREEGGNAMTYVFQSAERGEGFQIFTVPYEGQQVSEAQFKKDLPSGVRTGLKNISVDGATGASFYSWDIALGETYEVWFLNNGWLYEVTTLKSLEPWLNQILQTWLFTHP